MSNLNRIILIGKLENDPESRTAMDAVAVTRFCIAVSRPAGSGVDYIDIVSWRAMAELANQKLKKGSTVLVEGRIQIRSFENQSGERNWVTEVVAGKLQPLETKTAVKAAAASSKVDFEVEELPEDDLPF
ncbi:single-stranded DNA-binding protein [Candidatus Margulisiibacteriota bacterium]